MKKGITPHKAPQMDKMNYPKSAGHQGGDTDRAAAQKIEDSGRGATLRERVENLLRHTPNGLTADEAAYELGESILAIRPRFTELKRDGILVDRGERRKSCSKCKMRVLHWFGCSIMGSEEGDKA